MARAGGPRRALGAAPLLVADQAVVSGCNLATTVLLVRVLGLEAFGSYSLIWLAVLFAVGLGQALVGQPMMAIGPKQPPSDSQAYWAAAVWLQAALAAGLTALAALGLLVASRLGWLELDAKTSWAALLALGARPAHAFVRASLFARGQRRAACANDLVAYPGQLFLLATLALADRLTVASALLAVASSAGLATALGLARARVWRTSRAALREAWRRHLRMGRWLAATHATSFFASNAYLVAAGALLGPSAVGAIKAGHAVVGILHLVLLTMENAVPPSAARILHHHGPRALRGYLLRTGGYGLAAVGALAASVAAAAHPLLRFFYGAPVSSDTLLAVRALAGLYVFAFAIALFSAAFRTIEDTRPVFLSYAANALVALALATPVVARYGLAGALTGMLGQQALMAALLLAAATRRARGLSVAEAAG